LFNKTECIQDDRTLEVLITAFNKIVDSLI